MFTKLAGSKGISTIWKLRFVPAALDAVTGGGATHVDFDVRNRSVLHQSVGGVHYFRCSRRRRQHLPLDRNNPLSCIGGATIRKAGLTTVNGSRPSATALRLDRPQFVAVGSGNFDSCRTTDARKTWD